jgi:glutamyl-tRNA reductase
MSRVAGVVEVGVDHRCVALGVLGRLHEALRGNSAAAPGAAKGMVPLVTCHRVELYLEGVAAPRAAEAFATCLGLDQVDFADVLGHLVVRLDGDAGRHLLRVAAGLESAVLGEDQIQGQIREAYRTACAGASPGPLLHRLFHAAFRAGRRARGETSLKGGGRSLAGSAVTCLGELLGGLHGRTVLVVGAGAMAGIAAARLRERGVGRLLVCSRTWSHSHELAAALAAETLPWEWRRGALAEVAGVICAVAAPQPVLPASWIVEAATRRRGRLAVVDLGVPPGVEKPAVALGGLVVADLGDLSRRLAKDARRREGAVRAVEAIIEQELADWQSWAQARGAGGVRGGAVRPGVRAG